MDEQGAVWDAQSGDRGCPGPLLRSLGEEISLLFVPSAYFSPPGGPGLRCA